LLIQRRTAARPGRGWATFSDQRPRYLSRDNDRQYGRAFTGVAATSGVAVLRTAYHAPRENATCERFLGSVRRACLDHEARYYLLSAPQTAAAFGWAVRRHWGIESGPHDSRDITCDENRLPQRRPRPAAPPNPPSRSPLSASPTLHRPWVSTL
jgi:hypothetical protein